MFFINTDQEKDRMLLSELHKLIGLIFIDDIVFSYKRHSKNKECSQIVISPKESFEDTKTGKLVEVISSDILEKIELNFSMVKESNKPLDNLDRPIEEDNLLLNSTPDIDCEIKKIRVIIKKFLQDNSLKFEESIFPPNPIVCLTHDVDSLKGRSFFRAFGWLTRGLLHLNFLDSLRRSYHLFQDKADYQDSLEKISEIELGYGFRSTLFFLSLPFFISHEGRRYRITKKKYKLTIKSLLSKGFEIGLHTSRMGFRRNSVLNKEKSRLTQLVGKENLSGVRNHYLSGNFPKIWEVYEKHNLKYDASLGWSNNLGYRAKTSNPFSPINLKELKTFNLVEFPLIIMDSAIEDKGADYIFDQCSHFIKEAAKNKSVITLLWHTDRIYNPEYENYGLAYSKILQLLTDLNFKSKTCSEVLAMYRENSQKLKLNQSNYEL